MTVPRAEDGGPTESALVVPIPGAEGVVAGLRARLDPAAALGVPAHVTVIAPFAPPGRIDDDVLSALADLVGAVSAFDAAFAAASWFEERVLWLSPEPAARFRQLTQAVWERFPEFPPYGGVHDEIVPHLTVGIGQPLEVLRQAARSVEPMLPVYSPVTKVILMQGSLLPASWHTVAEFPLARLTG